MPTLTVTYPTLSDPADKTELEQNFSDVAGTLNALDNDNIAPNAGIGITKLEAYNYEFVVPLVVQSDGAAAPPLVRANFPNCVVAIPGSDAEGVSYTPISASYYMTDAGNAAATSTYKVTVGYAGSGGAATWTTVQTIISAVNSTITSQGAGNLQMSGDVLIDTSAIPLHASIQYFIGLELLTLAAGSFTTAWDLLAVTLKMRRTSGLRTV